MIASLQMATHFTEAIVLKLLEGTSLSWAPPLLWQLLQQPSSFSKTLRSLGFWSLRHSKTKSGKEFQEIFLALKGKDKMRKRWSQGRRYNRSEDYPVDGQKTSGHSLPHFTIPAPFRTTRRTRHADNGQEVITKLAAIAEYKPVSWVEWIRVTSFSANSHFIIEHWSGGKEQHFTCWILCVNAYIIYCESRPRNKLIHELFLVEVAKGLLIQTGHSSDDLENCDCHSFSDPAEVLPSFRLTGRHFLEELPPCDSGRLRQRVCCVCSKKKRKLLHDIAANHAKWHCAQPPVLKLYHTKAEPTRYLHAVIKLFIYHSNSCLLFYLQNKKFLTAMGKGLPGRCRQINY